MDLLCDQGLQTQAYNSACSQNNIWTLILDQTIFKFHVCDLKRRHCLQDLSLQVVHLFSNPVITHIITHGFDVYLIQVKDLSEGEDMLRKN